METELKMTLKEADRLTVMKLLEHKKTNLKQAAEDLDLCYKQACRIRQRYREEGPKGLLSKRREKLSNNHRPAPKNLVHLEVDVRVNFINLKKDTNL